MSLEEGGKRDAAPLAQKEELPPPKEQKRRVSFAPLLVPSPAPSASKPKRRWSLIRSLAKGKRLTSLTDEEEKVLKKLSSHGAKSSRELESTSSIDSAESVKARDDLRKSIAQHKHNLTQVETEFLQDLADAPDVEIETLENAHKTLQADPLYQSDEKTTPVTKENENQSQRLRTSILPSPAYRRELWLNLRAESQEMSAETFAFVSNTKPTDEETAEEPKENEFSFKPQEQAKRKSSKWGFFYQFQKALNLIDDRDKQDEETAELEEDDLDNDDATFCVLAHSIEDFLDNPTVLTPPIMDGLRAFLPFEVQHDNFWLKYSFARGDGASFYTLMDKIRNSARTFIAIETDQGDVFGCFTSSPWRLHTGYYGSAEAFVWRLKKSRFSPCEKVEDQIALESDVEVFEWTRHNRNVQTWTGMDGQIIVGGGGYDDDPDKEWKEYGAALTLSADLSRGSTEKCLTFNSPPLATRSCDGTFNISNIEVWTLTPVLSLEDAERLELSRQFIFDHGGFRRELSA